jgi:hypothetical protein
MILMTQHKEAEEEDMGIHDGIVPYLTSGSPPSARIIMRKQCCLAQMMSSSNLDFVQPVCQGAYRNLTESGSAYFCDPATSGTR